MSSDGFSWRLRASFWVRKKLEAFVNSELVGWAVVNLAGVAGAFAFLTLFAPPSLHLAVASLGVWMGAEYFWKNAHRWATLRSK